VPQHRLLIAAGPGEWRAAIVEDGAPVELYVERGVGAEAGSVHLGRVVERLPALAATLVDIGGGRPVFLAERDGQPRGRRLAEGERIVLQIRRPAQAGKAARATMRLVLGPGAAEEDIRDRALRLAPPARLHPPATFAAALAGAMPHLPDCVVVDEAAAIPEIRAAFPQATVRVEPEALWPVDLDALFEEALAPKVALAGGGTVHIEMAHAAVLMDVDSGSPAAGAPEPMRLAVDLAAAAVIARHLRLRNLGGGIVVDFVGLDQAGARARVKSALAKALASDPAQPQILGWTRLGHLELVRPRRGPSLYDALLEPVAGGSLVKSAATAAYEALRAVRRADRAVPGHGWEIAVAPEVAAALAGPLAADRRALEGHLARVITVTAEPGRPRERYDIVAR
jgi:ribonuclease G